jgi:hypothetical protein
MARAQTAIVQSTGFAPECCNQLLTLGEWVEPRKAGSSPRSHQELGYSGRVSVGDETSGSGCVLGGDQHAHSLSELPLGLEAAGVIRGGSGRDAMGLEHPTMSCASTTDGGRATNVCRRVITGPGFDCTDLTALAPSPTEAATRFTAPERASRPRRPRDARLERTGDRPMSSQATPRIDALEVPVRPNGAIRIERDFREPARGRLGADETEQTITAQVLRDPGRGGHHDAAQRPVPRSAVHVVSVCTRIA